MRRKQQKQRKKMERKKEREREVRWRGIGMSKKIINKDSIGNFSIILVEIYLNGWRLVMDNCLI